MSFDPREPAVPGEVGVGLRRKPGGPKQDVSVQQLKKHQKQGELRRTPKKASTHALPELQSLKRTLLKSNYFIISLCYSPTWSGSKRREVPTLPVPPRHGDRCV